MFHAWDVRSLLEKYSWSKLETLIENIKAEQQISLHYEVQMGKTVVHFLAQNKRYHDVHYVL